MMVQANYLFLFCSLLTTEVFCINDIFTLQGNDRISCVTEDMETPFFVAPPIMEEHKAEVSFLKNGKWINDDWSMKNSSSSLQAPVTDKRWEDFKLIHDNYTRFNNVSSVTFSIYSPSEIEYSISNEDSMFNQKINRINVKKWSHFTVLPNNQNVDIYENKEKILTIENFIPSQFVMKTAEKLYWKVHDYEFKWANTVHEQHSTTLIVPPTGKSCVMLYVSLCQNCLLKVGVTSGNQNKTEEFQATDTVDSLMRSWQTYKIDTEPDKESSITFHRRKISEDGDKIGYWAIDVRQCHRTDKNNKAIYNMNFTTVRKENHTCTFLSKQDEHEEVKTSKKFQCDPGMLGSKCDVRCKDVLGSGSSSCEKYRICQNFDCFCAWGYHGELCQESCKPGTWGLSCKNMCEPECETCNNVNGQCSKEGIWRFVIIIGIVILIVVVVGIPAFIVIITKRRNSRRLDSSRQLEQLEQFEDSSPDSNLKPVSTQTTTVYEHREILDPSEDHKCVKVTLVPKTEFRLHNTNVGFKRIPTNE